MFKWTALDLPQNMFAVSLRSSLSYPTPQGARRIDPDLDSVFGDWALWLHPFFARTPITLSPQDSGKQRTLFFE